MKKVLFLLAVLSLFGASMKVKAQSPTPLTDEYSVVVEEAVPAPNFTLKNLDGKNVSLSDFRGKWVVLDFWGSWCIWCVRGIPEMKNIYQELSPKVEFIGIDCGDTDEVWRDAVKKYELPWVNVYCPEDNSILGDYGIQGFPTKYVIDPEGNIYDLVIGEDPAFYEMLREVVK